MNKIKLLEHNTQDAYKDVGGYLLMIGAAAFYTNKLFNKIQPSLTQAAAFSLGGLSVPLVEGCIPADRSKDDAVAMRIRNLLMGPVAGFQLAALYTALRQCRLEDFGALKRPVQIATGAALALSTTEFLVVKGAAAGLGYAGYKGK